ncbi:ATP-binding protein [uncultured Desulfovibrio sp.]|uniref:ATP-binding protein n=1 Tax=uncultured Desulfovibrio sp. TaxID=167968 RepID=UPI002636FFE1|nr:ATP-binding protein [uncultured Desulfovibrio sp.]
MPDAGRNMQEIVVISGKGGTGKTSLAAAFAALARDTVFCDLDVDVPDLHIILRPEPRQSTSFMGGNKAEIRPADCVACGVCMEACRFDAVRQEGGAFGVDRALCEGCGVCVALCPQQAIDFPEAHCGVWHISDTRFGPMVHAALVPGQENSGRLVSLLKREARALARREGCSAILCDGSPGIGCPVVSSLAGATLAVAVVEPSLSGLHDFTRVAGVCRHFRLPVGVVINRWDCNPEGADALERAAREAGHAVFGRVPFDADMLRATARGLAATEADTALARGIRKIWDNIVTYRPRASATLRPFIPAAQPLPR